MTENEMAEALKLAREIATGDDGSGISLVARALIACREPVELSYGPDSNCTSCKCGGVPVTKGMLFCHNCGHPLVWK